MNEKNLEVLTNIIGAVESGGQVYGKRRYNAYEQPYKNTPNEHTITIGWAQCYGHEARQLIQLIFEADKDAFWHIDKSGIAEMLNVDWVKTKWNPTAKQKADIISLIDSPVGRKVQDEMFVEKMKKLISDCEKEYTSDVKAQMMYCEIRHLGGKGPCDRIFKRCNGKYDLDTIMASLVTDQKDSSSTNQVGDKIFWSRHLKCYEFIERYAVEEEVQPMAVIIGSARGDEHGGSGWDGNAKAGDQKQTSTDDWKGEVSKQYYYVHSKGWIVVRAIDPKVREMIARGMEIACSNKNYGYDQSQNRSAWDYLKAFGFDMEKLDTPKETDCAQLVRLCIHYAGLTTPDFYTATLVEVLKKTGYFEILTSDKYCKSSDYLLRGDILCTKTKGHTVVVLTNGAKAEVAPAPTPTPSITSKDVVKKFQTFLNQNYAQMLKSYCGGLLEVDGEYGKKTRSAAITVWKYMSNKYYGSSLTLGNMNFFASCKKAASKITYEEIAKHPTFGYILQGVLAGKGYYALNLDGVCGAKTKEIVKKFQKAVNLTANGEMNADTWHVLFN